MKKIKISDILLSITSCKNLYHKDNFEITEIFNIKKENKYKYLDNWDVSGNDFQKLPIYWEYFFSNVYEKARKVQQKIIDDAIKKFLLATNSSLKLYDYNENICDDIGSKIISLPDNIIINNINISNDIFSLSLKYIVKRKKNITLYIPKISSSMNYIYSLEASFYYLTLKKMNFPIDSVNFILINNDCYNNHKEISFYIYDKFVDAKTNVKQENQCRYKTSIVAACENGWIEKIFRQKLKRVCINVTKIYNDAIINLNQTNKKKKNNFYYQKSICKSIYGDCKYFYICKDKFLIYSNPLLRYNGNVFTKSNNYKKAEILENYKNIKEISYENINSKYHYLKSNITPYVNSSKFSKFDEKLLAAQYIVWFDFETICLPLSVCDNTASYQHIPFQCSIIVTENITNRIVRTENILLDTLNIKKEDLLKIIEAIYMKNAKYVVYNRYFEDNVVLRRISHLFSSNKNICNKINYIIDNIIDLEDLIKKGIYINKDLKGKSSIKILSQYIEKTDFSLDLFSLDSYKNLKVKNGLDATIHAINRFYNIYSKNKWNSIGSELKIYCESDVKWMIVVYNYVKSLI